MKLGLMAANIQMMLSREGNEQADQIETWFRWAADMGIDSLELGVGRKDRSEFVDRVSKAMETYRMDVELGYGLQVGEDDSRRATEEFHSFVEEVCRPLGVRIVTVVSPFHGGRWLKDPPLEVQMDRLANALSQLTPGAERSGIRIGIENHADYRCSELVSLIERVGSPNLGIKLDTGNAYCALEEPLQAAKDAAPYTVATHLKDQIVEAEPCNRGKPGGLLALSDCAMGQGHVDLPRVVQLLAEHGPLGDDLTLTLEAHPSFLRESVEYARSAFASFLEQAS